MIAVENLCLRAGAFHLNDLNFQVDEGQCAVLMGKTGCGKTTLLEAICGLKPVRSGRVLLLGKDVTQLTPGEREVGYVPQDLALFQTMTVRMHLSLALYVRKRPQADIDARVGEMADLLGINKLLERRPPGLSGGESQRVALGRALAHHPRVLVLDEPFSALDEETREEMYVLLRNVQKQTGVTTLHVTHSRSEAHKLADRLFVLKDGAVHEVTANGNGKRDEGHHQIHGPGSTRGGTRD